MSATEQETIEATESGLLVRSFIGELTAGDGRTIDARIVPYGEAAEVSDDGRTSYREMWMPGAFTDQARGAQAGRAKTVLVNFRHGPTMADLIGHGISLREEQDGFYGSFKILDGGDGDKALELVRAGALAGVSLEAYAKKSIRTAEGIVQRVKGFLVGIALTPRGAYQNAAVLAIREEELAAQREKAQAASLDIRPEILDRLRATGVHLPMRYREEQEEAHPADHPADDSGTVEEQHPPAEDNAEEEGDVG